MANQPGPESVAPPVPGKSHMTLYAVIGVLAAVAVAGASVTYYEYLPGNLLNPYVVYVTQVVWTQFGASVATSPGFQAHAGKTRTVTLQEYCPPLSGFLGNTPQTCSSGTPFIQTPGFGEASTNAPFDWSSGDTGASATVVVTIVTPHIAYSGNLTIDVH